MGKFLLPLKELNLTKTQLSGFLTAVKNMKAVMSSSFKDTTSFKKAKEDFDKLEGYYSRIDSKIRTKIERSGVLMTFLRFQKQRLNTIESAIKRAGIKNTVSLGKLKDDPNITRSIATTLSSATSFVQDLDAAISDANSLNTEVQGGNRSGSGTTGRGVQKPKKSGKQTIFPTLIAEISPGGYISLKEMDNFEFDFKKAIDTQVDAVKIDILANIWFRYAGGQDELEYETTSPSSRAFKTVSEASSYCTSLLSPIANKVGNIDGFSDSTRQSVEKMKKIQQDLIRLGFRRI